MKDKNCEAYEPNAESDNFSENDEEFLGRKSKRIQNQIYKSSQNNSPVKIDNKKGLDLKLANNDRKQLNGAQFVAAAAAGNFNVSASIGSTSITIDSNPNIDLNQLNQNIESLNSALRQHSVLLKQVNLKLLVIS